LQYGRGRQCAHYSEDEDGHDPASSKSLNSANGISPHSNQLRQESQGAAVAQLVEHRFSSPKVAGSIPVRRSRHKANS